MSLPAVYSDVGALAGSDLLDGLVGALLTIVLVVAVLMLVVSALTWAIGHAVGSSQVAARGRAGVLVCLGASVVAGAGVAGVNFLLDVGSAM